MCIRDRIGITSTSLVLGWYGGPLLAGALLRTMQPVAASYAVTLSVVCAFLLLMALHVILGELVPRLIVLDRIESMVLRFGRPLRIIYFLFYPMVCLTYTCLLYTSRCV